MWAMRGNAANNLLFARQIIVDNGIAIVAGANPVPLPAAFLALSMRFGRERVSSAELLRHDITAFAADWTALVLCCALMAALLAGAIARATGATPRVVAISAGIGSLLPASWFITGYSMDYGFFNALPALILLFAAIVVFLESPHPALTLGLLALVGTALLAVWSPLIVVPASIGAVVVATHSRDIVAARGWVRAAAVVGVLQLLVYGLAVVLPGVLKHGEVLGAFGSIYDFPTVMLPAASVSAMVLLALAVRTRRGPLVQLTVAVVLGLMAGLVVMLAAAGWGWSYYPQKFAWLATVTLVVVMAGLIVPVLSGRGRLRLVPVIGLVAVGILGVTLSSPVLPTGQRQEHPFLWILSGHVLGQGDDVAEQIFGLVDADHPRVY